MAVAPAPQPLATPSPAPAPAQAVDNETLAIAGGGGVAIVLLAGGAFALARRKRREEEEEVAYASEPKMSPTVPMAAEPVFMPTARPAAPLSAEPNALPGGFDLSRFGPHTQAAYRGPTLDNPSLSLKKRLKRASFFDRRERLAADAGIAAAPAAARVATMAAAAVAPAEVATRATPEPRGDQIVYRPQKLAKGGFRPAFRTSRA